MTSIIEILVSVIKFHFAQQDENFYQLCLYHLNNQSARTSVHPNK